MGERKDLHHGHEQSGPCRSGRSVASTRKAGYAMTAWRTMSAVKRCSCRWSTPHAWACATIPDKILHLSGGILLLELSTRHSVRQADILGHQCIFDMRLLLFF